MSDARSGMTPVAIVGGVALVLGLIVLLGSLSPVPGDPVATTQPTHDRSGVSGGVDAEAPAVPTEVAASVPAESPMMVLAAEAGDIDTIRALAAAGASLDEAGPGGMTALMAAAAMGEVESVFALLDLGADAARLDAAGRSAADHARARGDDSGALLARALDDAAMASGAPTGEPP